MTDAELRERLADVLGIPVDEADRTAPDRILAAAAALRSAPHTRGLLIPAAEAALDALRRAHPKMTRKDLIEATLVGAWVIIEKRPQDSGILGALRWLAAELERRPPAAPDQPAAAAVHPAAPAGEGVAHG